MKLTDLTISEAQKGLRAKQFSAVELVESALSRMTEVEEKVQAFITQTPEEARIQAKEADALLAKGEGGALTGIPTAVKDCFCTKGVRTTNASRILENFIPPYDAPSWSRLKKAGAIMVGKTNTDEHTMGSSTETSYFQTSKNPWDTSRIPGGSSGGSAAAVVSGECLFGTATDTGGSIRQPASVSGCTGLKVTYGRVPRTYVLPMASSLDSIGMLAKTCEDCAIILQEMAGPDGLDATAPDIPVPDYLSHLDGSVKGMKLGVPKEYFIEGLDAGVEKAVREAIETYRKLGAEICEISLPHTKYAIATYYIIAPAEVSANMARYDGIRFGHRTEEKADDLVDFYKRSRAEGFGDEVKRRIMIGTYVLSAGYYDAYYKKAQKVRTLVVEDFAKAFQSVDAILTPTAPTPAFKVGENTDDPIKMYLSDVFTVTANIAGVCGASIPCGFSDGLPVGLQILGPQYREEVVLKVGDAFQRNTDYHKQFPENIK